MNKKYCIIILIFVCNVRRLRREISDRARANLFWRCPQCNHGQRMFLLIPCRHLGMCQNCESKRPHGAKCHVCKANVLQKIKIEMDNTTSNNY